MNCKNIKLKLQEIIDSRGNLSEIKNHLKNCPSCKREFEFLQSVKQSIKNTQYLKPSYNFNRNVMVELGLIKKPALLQKPLVWVFSTAAVAMVCWVISAAVFLTAKYGMSGILELVKNPSQIIAFASIYLAKISVYTDQTLKIITATGKPLFADIELPKILAASAVCTASLAGFAGYNAVKNRKINVKGVIV